MSHVVSRARGSSSSLLVPRPEKLPASQAGWAQTQECWHPRYFCYILFPFLPKFVHSLPRRSNPPVCTAALIVGCHPCCPRLGPSPRSSLASAPPPSHRHPRAFRIPAHPGALGIPLGPWAHRAEQNFFLHRPHPPMQPRKGFWGILGMPWMLIGPTPPLNFRMPPSCPSMCSRRQACPSGVLYIS